MKLTTLIPIGILALSLAACGDNNYGGQLNMTPAESKAHLDAEIQKIKDNPKMPPQAKAAAIASMQNAAHMVPGDKKGQ